MFPVESDTPAGRWRSGSSCGGRFTRSEKPSAAALLQQLRQRALHRISPDLITLLIGVQQIRHDVLGQRAVRFKKLRADVEELHHPAIVEFGERGVDLL